MAVYRGVDPSAPITDSAIAVQTSSSTTHVTPTVSAPDGAHWLVSHWGDKSSATTDLAPPPGVTQRDEASSDAASGHVTTLHGDSNGPVPAGNRGGLTATADQAAGAAITFSVLLKPAS
ncbi:hypothetical protein L615_002800000440 [Nocardioides sp. J9]|nr:hypothetical protein L615_002800000440 [Nocardioides sp. J9]